MSLPLVSLAALVVLAHLFLTAGTSRRAALIGWMGGIGYFAGTIFWIVEPFFVDAAQDGWMAPFALLFMAAGLALFWALGFGAAYRLGRGRKTRLVALVVCFGLAELTRSYAFTGFPWGLLAYIWSETPVMQLIAFGGLHGLGAFTLVLIILPLLRTERFVQGAIVSALLLAFAYGAGLHRLSTRDVVAPDAVHVRLIQPNAPQHLKWRPDMYGAFFERQIALTREPFDAPLDLVIWPETAVPFWLEDAPGARARIAAAAGEGTRVVLGARRLESGPRYFNSLAVLDRGGNVSQVYDKHHLVPFGEYVPFGNLFSKLGVYGMAAEEGGGYSAGPGPRVLNLEGIGKILPLICYEAIFPQDVAGAPVRPDWMLQITNDAWFGDTAGPQQHLAQARARTIEQGLPMVRVANTGVSGVIDAKGRMTASIALGEAGKVDAYVPSALPPTFYAKTGDWLVFALLLMSFGGLLLRRATFKH